MKKLEGVKIEAKPILKWAGGKRQLEDVIVARILKECPDGIDDYCEPFAGGAAIFFALRSRGLIRGKAYLSDTNAELMDMYEAVRDDVGGVLRALRSLCKLEVPSAKGTEAEIRYYTIRASVPRSSAARAARTIYLNKNCYNGLYRVNKSGGFNVPWGKRKTPYVPEEDEIRAASAALQGVELEEMSFRHTRANPRAFYYFDPPYVPASKSSDFTAYQKEAFGQVEHERLADLGRSMRSAGIPFLISNSDTKASRALYKGPEFSVKKVQASRNINSVASSRGKVSELLVSGKRTK